MPQIVAVQNPSQFSSTISPEFPEKSYPRSPQLDAGYVDIHFPVQVGKFIRVNPWKFRHPQITKQLWRYDSSNLLKRAKSQVSYRYISVTTSHFEMKFWIFFHASAIIVFVGNAGGTGRLSRYAPLQSDVTTLLSSILLLLRSSAAVWAGSLCWHSAFFLMEKAGLQRGELDQIISHGVPTLPACRQSFTIFRIGIILLATLSAQDTSLILTGAIS